MIKAVIFDLDDTLFPETDYVKSGFKAIADHFNDEVLYHRLLNLFMENRNNVYQRAGFSEEECKRCIEIYRSHFPALTLDDETKETLMLLKEKGYLLGIITDGRPEGQRNKIKALGLSDIMDCIIVTDELGGEQFRKPNPKSFEIMREALSVEFDEMMYVGDNPAKDFYIGSICSIKTCRITKYADLYKNAAYYMNVRETVTIANHLSLIQFLEE